MSELTPPEPVSDSDSVISQDQTVAALRWAAPAGGAVLFLAALVGLTPLWIGVVGVLVAVSPLLVNLAAPLWRWQAPVCQVSGLVAPLGGVMVVSYERQSRKPVDVSGGMVVAELTCTEKVRYRTTDSDGDRVTRTRTTEVGQRRFGAPVQPTASGFTGTVTVTVPVDFGAPTFDLGDNEVGWELKVWAEGGRLPTGRKSFDVEVQAVLSPELVSEPPVDR